MSAAASGVRTGQYGVRGPRSRPLRHDRRRQPGCGEGGEQRVQATDPVVAEPGALLGVTVHLHDGVVHVHQRIAALLVLGLRAATVVGQPRRLVSNARVDRLLRSFLVFLHHTRVCRLRPPQSTTLERTRQRVERGQPLDREPMPQREAPPRSVHACGNVTWPVPAAGRRPHLGAITTLGEQNLQPLPGQRVERMGDDERSQVILGRCGTMPPPSGSRAGAAFRLPCRD